MLETPPPPPPAPGPAHEYPGSGPGQDLCSSAEPKKATSPECLLDARQFAELLTHTIITKMTLIK